MYSHGPCTSSNSSTSHHLSTTNASFCLTTPKGEPVSPPASPKPSNRRGPIIVYGGGLKWNFPVHPIVNLSSPSPSSSSSNDNNNSVNDATPLLVQASRLDKRPTPLDPAVSSECTAASLTKRQKINRTRKLSLKQERLHADKTASVCPVWQKHLLFQPRLAEKRAKCLFVKDMKEPITAQEQLNDGDIKPFAIKQEPLEGTEIIATLQKSKELLSRAENISDFALKFRKIRQSYKP